MTYNIDTTGTVKTHMLSFLKVFTVRAGVVNESKIMNEGSDGLYNKM